MSKRFKTFMLWLCIERVLWVLVVASWIILFLLSNDVSYFGVDNFSTPLLKDFSKLCVITSSTVLVVVLFHVNALLKGCVHNER